MSIHHRIVIVSHGLHGYSSRPIEITMRPDVTQDEEHRSARIAFLRSMLVPILVIRLVFCAVSVCLSVCLSKFRCVFACLLE